MQHKRTDPALSKDRNPTGPNAVRPLFWASAGFYILIAFEFFYMASPFAAYFYAVYGPGLDGLQSFGLGNWTLWFFLPHIVEYTRSPFINQVETLGLVLFFGGIPAFAIGAFQVYRAKLLKQGAVTGGLYVFIRHPQYTALIVASIGMLLIWPRFLVLFATVAVIFAYIALARVEEADCLHRYPGYAIYHDRTGMFFPRRWTAWLPAVRLPLRPRWLRIVGWVVIIMAALMLSTVAAFGLRHLAISSLITHRTQIATYVSVTRISDADLAQAAAIAEAAGPVRAALLDLPSDATLLAYVLPTEMYISEIPMTLPDGEQFGHSVPRDADPNRWKVVFAQAVFAMNNDRIDPGTKGSAVIAQAVNKQPIIEVHVNLGTDSNGTVEATWQPPETPFYAGRQVPVF